LRKHVLAQKANRSRRYGRIGSVSQQQTNTPRIISVAAHYPTINQTDILHTEKEGTLRGLRQQPLVRLKVSCLPSQPFYLYGTFHDGKAAYLSFFVRVLDPELDFQFKMPASAQDPKIHASLTPPPPHYSHHYISEAKSEWVKSRSLLATDEDFFNLGFTPATPTLWRSGENMSKLSGSGTSEYWSGRKSDFDPRIHGFGGYKTKSQWKTDLYGGSKDYIPTPIASWACPAGVPYTGKKYDAHWFVIAEYVEDKGWLVLPQSQPTLKAGHPYCIMGARYTYKNLAKAKSPTGTEMVPAEGADAPIFAFTDREFVDMFGTGEYKPLGGDFRVQKYEGGIHGGYVPFDFNTAPKEMPEGVDVTIANLYQDNGAGWFFDSLGEDGKTLSSMLQTAGVPSQNTKVIDYFSADVEYYDFNSKQWSDTRPKRTCDSKGRFAWYFRFKRQLDSTHPDAAQQPDWVLPKTQDAYPRIVPGSSGKKLGRTMIGFGQSIEPSDSGFVRVKYDTEPVLTILSSMEMKHPTLGETSRYAWTSKNVKVADPDNFVYSTNQNILRAFYEGGEFKPGNKVLMIGRGLDKTRHIMVSKEKSIQALATARGFGTPEELMKEEWVEQYWSKSGSVNESSIGYLKPLYSVSATDFIAGRGGASPAVAGFINEVFYGMELKDVFSSFLDPDQEVAGYLRWQMESLDPNRTGKIFAQLALRFSPLDDGVAKQVRDRPTHYEISSGNGKLQFPYTVAVFEIPAGYSGPAPVIAAKLGNKTITFAEAKKMVEEAAQRQGISTSTSFGTLGQTGTDTSVVENAITEFVEALSRGQVGGTKFPMASQRAKENENVYLVYSDTNIKSPDGVSGYVNVYCTINPRSGATSLSVASKVGGDEESVKNWTVPTRAYFDVVKPKVAKHFDEEVTRITGTSRQATATTETEIIDAAAVGEKVITLMRKKTTIAFTQITYEVTVFSGITMDGSTVEETHVFDTQEKAQDKFDTLLGSKKLIRDLEYIHDPSTPSTVYYRFMNSLGRNTTGFAEDLAAEIDLQLEKENLGLTKLEQLMTDPVSVPIPEDVEEYDIGEQRDAERDVAAKERAVVPTKPLFRFSMPKVFRTFKTDNLLRKHTLLPYGSRTPIEDDPTE
jgi:hypothetical protein